MNVSWLSSRAVVVAFELFVNGSGTLYGGRSDVPGRGRGYFEAYERMNCAMNTTLRVTCIGKLKEMYTQICTLDFPFLVILHWLSSFTGQNPRTIRKYFVITPSVIPVCVGWLDGGYIIISLDIFCNVSFNRTAQAQYFVVSLSEVGDHAGTHSG